MSDQAGIRRVKIIGQSGAQTWYAGRIGHEITVQEIGTNLYYQDVVSSALVFKQDCELVADTEFLEEKGAEIIAIPEKSSVLNRQIGGTHYKDMAIQPGVFIAANRLEFFEGCIIKRACRHDKPTGKGVEDIRKLIDEARWILEHKYGAIE